MYTYKKTYDSNIKDLVDSCEKLIAELKGKEVEKTDKSFSHNNIHQGYEDMKSINKNHIEQAIEQVKTVLKQISKIKPVPFERTHNVLYRENYNL